MCFCGSLCVQVFSLPIRKANGRGVLGKPVYGWKGKGGAEDRPIPSSRPALRIPTAYRVMPSLFCTRIKGFGGGDQTVILAPDADGFPLVGRARVGDRAEIGAVVKGHFLDRRCHRIDGQIGSCTHGRVEDQGGGIRRVKDAVYVTVMRILRIYRDIHEVFASGKGQGADAFDRCRDLDRRYGGATEEGTALHGYDKLPGRGILRNNDAGIDAGSDAGNAAGPVAVAGIGEAVADVGQIGLGLGFGLGLLLGLRFRGIGVPGGGRRKEAFPLALGLGKAQRRALVALGLAALSARELLRIGKAEKGNGERERNGKGDCQYDHQRLCHGFHECSFRGRQAEGLSFFFFIMT